MQGPYKCSWCSSEFPKWGQLQRHERAHAEDKPHRCPRCDASFNHELNLRLHAATHQGDPVCPECGKRFARLASLKAHLMLHQKEENLICADCGDEFSTQVMSLMCLGKVITVRSQLAAVSIYSVIVIYNISCSTNRHYCKVEEPNKRAKKVL